MMSDDAIPGQAPTHEAFTRAAELYDLKQYGDAGDIAEAALSQSDDDGRLWQLLGAARWHQGRHADARAALETAGSLVPLRPYAQRILAECYVRDGHTGVAAMMFRHLIRRGRCPSDLLPGVAATLNRLGEHRLALRACRQLVRRHPSHHQAHFGVAYYLNRLGASPRKILKPLKRAMLIAPHLLHYRVNFAFVLASLGRHAKASEILSEINPDRIVCPAWLKRMHDIHNQAGAGERAEACQHQLARIAEGRV